MKFTSTLIGTMMASLLFGASAWAEEGKMPMQDAAAAKHEAKHEAKHQATHDMSNMHDKAHDMTEQAGMEQTGMEQTGDADTAMQDKTTDDAMLVEQSGFSRGSVVRSVFTSAVEDREPTDSIKELSTNSDKVIYYTELRDMAGQTARHRWEYNGEVMAEVEFNVGGSRWRVWSSKSFVPGWTGEWKVSVLNGANEVISEDVLNYTASVAEPEVEKSAPPAAPVDVEGMQAQ